MYWQILVLGCNKKLRQVFLYRISSYYFSGVHAQFPPTQQNTKIISCDENKNHTLVVKLKLAQVVCWNNSEELKPSLDEAKSNCRRLSSIWYPPITIEVLGFDPPSTNPKHSTSLLTWTIEFEPNTLQNTLSLCRTKSIWGTAGPTRVLPMFLELKHAPNGATDATLGTFASSLMKALMTAL